MSFDDLSCLNVKILNNLYLTTLRLLYYDPVRYVNKLEAVRNFSRHLLGESIQYKYCQIYLELGEANTSIG